MRTNPVYVLLLAAMATPLAAQNVPHVFQDNSPALASEVNENFGALATALDSTEARVDQLEAQAASASITHLNVEVGELRYLSSYCLNNDNSLTDKFYFDRSSNELAIPEGYSFVVTDVFAFPGGCPTLASTSDRWLAVIDGPRTFVIQFRGDSMQHYPLSGGLAYAHGDEPAPRNTGSSSGSLQITLIGYFVEGDAPSYGEAGS